MISTKALLGLSLLGSALAAPPDTWVFATNEQHYVYDGNVVGGNTQDTEHWDMHLLSGVESVQVSGDVTLNQGYFSFTADQPNQGLVVGYHGGSITVDQNMAVDNRKSPSSLEVTIEGSSFSSNKGAFAMYAQAGQRSSCYVDFTRIFQSFDNQFYNMETVTFSPNTNVNSIKLISSNSNVYIGNIYVQLDYWQADWVPTTVNGTVWFDGGIWTGRTDSAYFRFQDPGAGKNAFIINDEAFVVARSIQLFEFDTTPNSYIAFKTPIISASYQPRSTISNNIVGDLNVKTANKEINFPIFSYQNEKYSTENFVSGSMVLNRNGTDTTVYTLQFQKNPVTPTVSSSLPQPSSSKHCYWTCV